MNLSHEMDHFKSSFLNELHARGFLHQCTHIEALDALLSAQSVCFYIGYDATAPSLHVGNLLTIMLMRLAQRHGHQPFILMGGGTTKVADPSGKDKSRPPLSHEAVQQNTRSIQSVFAQYIDFKGPSSATMINNADWLDSLNYLSFLETYGPHFTINRMLTFDSVKLRLEREQPLSFLEFNYMILQAYDFLKLYRDKNCLLQMGGSDQWGNIVNGVELIRRVEGKQAFGLTIPLITTASGAKMGKSASGAVWLNGDMLSPYDYWQYWRNTEDADVIRFMKYFTDLSLEEIHTYENFEGAALNQAKVRLADEATRLAHGETALAEVKTSIKKLFEEKSTAVEVVGVDEAGQPLLQAAVPITRMTQEQITAGVPVYAALVQLGFVSSNGEAKRLIKGGGCRLNDETVSDPQALLSIDLVKEPGVIKVAAGKKRFGFLQIISAV